MSSSLKIRADQTLTSSSARRRTRPHRPDMSTAPSTSPPPTMVTSNPRNHGWSSSLGLCSGPCPCRSGEAQVWHDGPIFPFPRLQGILSGGHVLFSILSSRGGICWYCFAMLSWGFKFWFAKIMDRSFRFSIASYKVGHFIYGLKDRVWPDFVYHFHLFNGR